VTQDPRATPEPSLLDRALEVTLTTGVALSFLLLLAGLVAQQTPLLGWGMLVLLATPVFRVVIVTFGMLRRRDWLFFFLSLWVLAVLASSLLLAARLSRSRAGAASADALVRAEPAQESRPLRERERPGPERRA
jgi:uncharacterized membrane protein